MKSRQSRRLLALTAMMCVSSALTSSMENVNNKLDVNYIENLINRMSINNMPKMLPDENYYENFNSTEKDYRILLGKNLDLKDLCENYGKSTAIKENRILCNLEKKDFCSRMCSDLYLKLKNIIEIENSSHSSDKKIASLMSDIRTIVDTLVNKKLTNGKHIWDMRVVPKNGLKCLIPLNLYEFELKLDHNYKITPRTRENTIGDACMLYAMIDLPKNFEKYYVDGVLNIEKVDLKAKSVYVSISSKDFQKKIFVTGKINGHMMGDALGWWEVNKSGKQK